MENKNSIMILEISRMRSHDLWTDRRERINMKSTGIIRKVDDLGRIVLPIELRRMLDIAERDDLEIFVEQDRIILQKFEPACIFCSSSQGLITYKGKNVCRKCVQKMANE